MKRCSAFALFVLVVLQSPVRADDWPQWLGPKRDGIWRETGILDKFPKDGPKIVWRVEIHGGYTGPAIVGDRVYVMDRVKPKDAKEGENPPPKGSLPGSERVLCLDAKNGKILWKQEYDCPYRISYPAGPRTTPVVENGKVYTLGAMGDLMCLDAAKGTVLWKKELTKDYQCKPPIWGYAAHPLIDGDRLFCLVGGEKSAAVAFDKNTGKELWKALTVEEIGYAPPMVFEGGGKKQLIIWHTEAVNALNPETGELFWTIQFPPKGVDVVRPGITVSTPQKAGDRIFITAPHHGPLMLGLDKEKPNAKILWKGKSNNVGKPDGLHSLNSSPQIKDNHIYGICTYGILRCLEADTGKRLWESDALASEKGLFACSFLVQQGDRFFIFTDKGDLVIANLSPKGYEEISKAHIIDPSQTARGRDVVWSHPAFANKRMYVRNDKEIVCVELAK